MIRKILKVRPIDLPMKVKLILGKKENVYTLKKTKKGNLRLYKEGCNITKQALKSCR